MQSKEMSLSEQFIMGGSAACLASAMLYPFHLTRVRLQLMDARSRRSGTPFHLMKILDKEGLRTAYAGFSTPLLRQAVYGTTRIGLYRVFSGKFFEKNDREPLSFSMKVAAALVSGAIAGCIGTPIETVIMKMQANSLGTVLERKNYDNFISALRRVSAEDGPRALFSGCFHNILRGAALNVGMLAVYDEMKQYISVDLKRDSSESEMGAAIVAGLCGALATWPFEMMQNSKLNVSNLKYSGFSKSLISTLQTRAGFASHMSRCAPSSIITLLLLEQMSQLYNSKHLLSSMQIPEEGRNRAFIGRWQLRTGYDIPPKIQQFIHTHASQEEARS